MEKSITTAKSETTPPTFKKKIGRTTYEVSVHFSPNARETLHKKIERIILNSVQNNDF